MIKPGTYRLMYTVKNPKADRRKTRDTRCQPKWDAGTEMLAIERSNYGYQDDEHLATLTEEQRAAIREKSRYVVLQFVGDPYPFLHEIGPGDPERYAALIAALQPVEESTGSMFTRLGVSNRECFARWLVESGSVSRESFEALWRRFEDTDEDHPS